MMTVPGASPTIYPKDTNKFVPERWDREKEGHAHIDKFAHVPFGFGPRMCVGERNISFFIVCYFREKGG